VVDRVRQVPEESLQRGRIGRIEGGGAPRVDVERYPLEALGIATCEHDLGTLGASTSGCGEPLCRRCRRSRRQSAAQFGFALLPRQGLDLHERRRCRRGLHRSGEYGLTRPARRRA
jgi:hypothetical protein